MMGSCDITCQCLLLQRFPRTTSCLLEPYFIAWSLSNWISLKQKTRCPHEGTLLGLGRSVRAAPKGNYTHEIPWILSLWNLILFVACSWQTESILRMGQGSFKGIPASKIESHSKSKLEHFFMSNGDVMTTGYQDCGWDKNEKWKGIFPKNKVHSTLLICKLMGVNF